MRMGSGSQCHEDDGSEAVVGFEVLRGTKVKGYKIFLYFNNNEVRGEFDRYMCILLRSNLVYY